MYFQSSTRNVKMLNDSQRFLTPIPRAWASSVKCCGKLIQVLAQCRTANSVRRTRIKSHNSWCPATSARVSGWMSPFFEIAHAKGGSGACANRWIRVSIVHSRFTRTIRMAGRNWKMVVTRVATAFLLAAIHSYLHIPVYRWARIEFRKYSPRPMR